MNNTRHPCLAHGRHRTALAVTLALCAVSAAAQDAPASSRGWFALALLPKVGDVFIAITQQGAGCVFTRLLNFLGAGTNPNSPNCNTGAAGVNYVPAGAQFNAYGNSGWNAAPPVGWQGQQAMPPGAMATGLTAGYTPTPGYAPQSGYAPPPGAVAVLPAGMTPLAPVLTAQTAGVLSTQPLLSFMVQKLADNAPRSPVVGVLAQDQLQAQAEPSFALTSGEAFAIRFSTTVPGRVRLINTDVDSNVSVSSLYEAVPGGDNRMPREHEGGILMTGKPGIEYLVVEFVPCISPSLAQHPAVSPFAGALAPCSLEAATRQYLAAQAGGRGALADWGGKAMSFPANSDPTQPVAIAPADYAKGEALRFRLRIQHLARP